MLFFPFYSPIFLFLSFFIVFPLFLFGFSIALPFSVTCLGLKCLVVIVVLNYPKRFI
jgi:hypothetical protein